MIIRCIGSYRQLESRFNGDCFTRSDITIKLLSIDQCDIRIISLQSNCYILSSLHTQIQNHQRKPGIFPRVQTGVKIHDMAIVKDYIWSFRGDDTHFTLVGALIVSGDSQGQSCANIRGVEQGDGGYAAGLCQSAAIEQTVTIERTERSFRAGNSHIVSRHDVHHGTGM